MSTIVTEIVTDDIPEGEEFCKVTSDRVVTAFVVVGAILLACAIAGALFLARIL